MCAVLGGCYVALVFIRMGQCVGPCKIWVHYCTVYSICFKAFPDLKKKIVVQHRGGCWAFFGLGSFYCDSFFMLSAVIACLLPLDWCFKVTFARLSQIYRFFKIETWSSVVVCVYVCVCINGRSWLSNLRLKNTCSVFWLTTVLCDIATIA